MQELSQNQIRIGIKLLTKAKKALSIRKNYFVCTALNRAMADLNKEQDYDIDVQFMRTYLSRWIYQMLGSSSDFDSWVWNQSETAYAAMNRGTSDGMFAARIAWIEWMIGELQKEIQCLPGKN